MQLKSYKELHVWQKAMALVTSIYQLSATFPKEEIYGLTTQMRKSVVSVPSNLAEGASRESTKDFLRFISIAYGSLAELETQLHIAVNLKYVTQNAVANIEQETNEIGRMLNGLEKALKEKLESSLTTNHKTLATPYA